MIEINIDGIEQLIEALAQAPEALEDEMEAGVQEIAEEIQRRAQQVHRFRNRTGNLEDSIKAETSGLRGRVYVDMAQAPYGRYVIDGTRPHDIMAKRAKALEFGDHFSKKVHHPGTQPDDFMDEAEESVRGQIDAVFSRHVDEAMRKAGIM